jgi:hypothetical protein
MARTTNRPDDSLVTIATFATEFEAGLARGALESIGVRALVPSEALSNSSRVRAFGRAELQVFESDRKRALTELGRMQIRLVEPASD